MCAWTWACRPTNGVLDFSNWADRWLVHIPFSLYTAWITVATVANVAGTLVYYEWGGWGISEPVWSVIMMGVLPR
jgi:hypothetical protein